jgi:glycerol-3-phosphate cytidylyltransferase-like family protein
MNFYEYISESKQQLDISIQAAEKYLTTDSKIKDFLFSEVSVEHKTDGVKLTVIKQANNGNLKDYIFAYKGNILYSTEYNFQPTSKIKKESIGSSQFKLVFEHFDSLSKNSIPVGTELFIEFLMSKPTISSNYSTKHKMVLIGYSASTFKENFGKLITSPSGFFTEKRNEYAKELKIDVPQLLFKGILGSQISFESGIINKNLRAEFDKRKNVIRWDSIDVLNDIKDLFLSIESKYGGNEEGIVIKFKDKILKFQQKYQLDQEARLINKLKYKDNNPAEEAKYWDNVKRVSLELVNSVQPSKKLDDVLAELSLALKRMKLTFSHAVKTETNIKDDIQLNAKTLLIKKMKGNNNVLVIGKFRIFTKEGHYKLIKRALTLYDNVVVCIVTGSDTIETKDFREEMVKKCFPNVQIVHSNNGNILSILNKIDININIIYAGSDRVQSYMEQIRNNVGISVRELQRNESGISASKIISNINDKEFFLKNTPKEIHDMYRKALNYYVTNNV